MSISEDDIRKVCAVCQVVYGGNPQGKYDSHGYCLSCYEKEMVKFGFDTRMPQVIGALTGEQFVDLMRSQDENGKHGFDGTPSHDWVLVAKYAIDTQDAYPSEVDKPFLLLDRVPIHRLAFGHPPENRSLVQQYAAGSGIFPPIYIGLPQPRYQKIINYEIAPHALVINGNHRLKAAQIRKDGSIPAVLNQESWFYYRTLFASV